MPELPEVETIKRALDKVIKGAKISDTKVFCRKFRVPIPDCFEQKTICATITDIKRIAKYIVLELDNKHSIIWHLGMSGKIKICESVPQDLQKHDHAVFYTDKGVIIFNDARRFGMLDIVESAKLNEHFAFKNLGIDPFDEKLTADYLKQKLKNKKTPVKVALLDQSVINGIGNIYASEALYSAKISPLRESYTLSLAECESLIEAIKETLTKAIKAGGSTLRDYAKPDGSTGYFQDEHCVYNKTGQACPNCSCNLKTTKGIKKIVQAGRSTFYCQTLQK
ncbi:MAG: bifunctional DNA-formamidopyrimidine glycosylase/DNA-(apurinic or apyrimidinic site) lyase [Alphaproteobacteria bacterium]|nr:bifunctional DNA-formamidopyrimidine glycosylase/DNA-(apurinic or apyrimidinic site) lyase [Alphaproteobacteria bacterium]